jgi:hypothetical protein
VQRAEFGREIETVPAWHVEVQQVATAAKASSALAASWRSQSGCKPVSALVATMRASLLSSTMRTVIVM